LVALACAPADPTDPGLPDQRFPFRAQTSDGRFDVAVRTEPAQIPLNEPFELVVHVRDHLDSSSGVAGGVDLSVDGFMPGHGHGMLRQARAEREGYDTWRVRGMLFHMGGEWELRLRLAWREDQGEHFTIRHHELAFPCAPVVALRTAKAEALAFFDEGELERLLAASPLPAPPPDPTNAVADDPLAAELGRKLFYDERLSGSGTVSCASCHDPDLGWSDGRTTAVGLAEVDLHTPTLWNGAHQRWQFWDGRADSQWAQALQPIEDEREMGGSRAAVLELIAGDPELRAPYEQVFGSAELTRGEVDGVFADVGKAIAAFERKIVTGETPFDSFVRGLETGDEDDLAALSDYERVGAKLFFGKANCHLCHSGPTFSDLEFHDARVPVAEEHALDPGRYAGIAKAQRDPFNGLGEHSDDRGEIAREKLLYLARSPHTRGEFKTPGLRNVAQTAPYMHGGQYERLVDVVEHYSTLEDAPPKRHQDAEDVLVPVQLSEREKAQLVAFLHTLSSGPPSADLLDPELEPEG
jgi:cytochrome c peroxidase